MVRGVERRTIFVDDQDREDLLRRLDLVLEESRVECLAWALIPNHFHLVLRIGDVPLSRVMSRIGTGYARRFNERHVRVGHLFQNRYLSRPIRDDADLLGIVRYVHLNPVRHRIVPGREALDSFPWCGHAALIGERQPHMFHAVDAALRIFADTRTEARRQLQSWMTAEPEPLPADAAPAATLDPGELLELAQMARRADEPPGSPGELDRVRGLVASLAGIAADELRGPSKRHAAVRGRALVCHLASTRLGLSNHAIAHALEISERAAARGTRLGAQLAESPEPIARALRSAWGESPDRRDCPRLSPGRPRPERGRSA